MGRARRRVGETGRRGERVGWTWLMGSVLPGVPVAARAAPAMGAAGGDHGLDHGLLGQLGRLVEMGGPIIVVLLLLSVVALAIALAKLVQFIRLRVWSHGFVDDVARTMHGGDFARADALLGAARGPVATVMRAAAAGRAGATADAVVREEVDRIARAELDVLERGLPQLGLIATISPLLGLLGTVTGLIDSFQQLADAGDRVDPAILSGGIWEALLTTVAGLVVAIPAAAAFALLQRTVDLTARRMEDAATRVFTVDLYRRRDGGRADAACAPAVPPADPGAAAGEAAELLTAR